MSHLQPKNGTTALVSILNPATWQYAASKKKASVLLAVETGRVSDFQIENGASTFPASTTPNARASNKNARLQNQGR